MYYNRYINQTKITFEVIFMMNTLCHIGNELNKANILWAVGASILLMQHKLVNSPNDIDLLIHINDIEKADKILKSMGEKKTFEKTDIYSTEYFYEYVINGFDIDVMSGLKINHYAGTYNYIFDKDSISQYININDINIPLTSLEDWYVLYQLIPNREKKVKIIEDYLKSTGINNTNLLKRSLLGNLPSNVEYKIRELLIYDQLYN